MKITCLLNSFLVLALLLGIAPNAHSIEPLNTFNGRPRNLAVGNPVEPRDRPVDILGDLTVPEAVQSQAQNLGLVGHLGGGSRAVFVQSAYAYVAVGSELAIVDISDPVYPQRVGYAVLPDLVTDVYVFNNYAYVAWGGCAYTRIECEGGLQVLDVSDPTAPTNVGFYDSPDNVVRVIVRGQYAYLAEESINGGIGGGLRIVDISNPQTPVSVGFYDSPGSSAARDLALMGDYVYLADWDAGLRIIDVSNPVGPVEVGSYTEPEFYAYHVAVVGTFVYVTSLYALRVIDVSNPNAPFRVSLISDSEQYHYSTNRVTITGNYAYFSAEGHGLLVINVSDPTIPVIVGLFETPGSVSDTAVVGDYAYVTDSHFGLRVLDVLDPSNPTQVGVIYMPMFRGSAATVGEYVYATNTQGYLFVMDVSHPVSPTVVGLSSAPATAGDGKVVILDNYAYIAGDGLSIMDISTATSPVQVGYYDGGIDVGGVDVVGDYAYLISVYPGVGVHIVDISNPVQPVQVGSYPVPPSDLGHGIDVAGSYAYAAIAWDGLQIVDISNPVAPFVAGYYQRGGFGWTVVVRDSYAYLADYWLGLDIVDVSRPATPTWVGNYNTNEYDTSGSAIDVAVAGERAYVLYKTIVEHFDQGTSLRMLDISNPANPLEIGRYDLPASNVTVAGGYIYAVGAELFILSRTFSARGHVVGANGMPVADVAIISDSGSSAVTDATGTYTISNFLTGTHTLTPVLGNYVFRPPTRTVTVPPDANHSDFVILPAPTSTTLIQFITTTLTYTDIRGLPTHLTFPADAVLQTTGVVLTPTLASDSPGLAFVGHAFDLAGYQDGTARLDLTFNVPATATIHYSDTDVRVVTDESELTLRWWDGSTWVDATATCGMTTPIYNRDADDNVLSAPICRTGRYALFGPTHQAFLPLVTRRFR